MRSLIPQFFFPFCLLIFCSASLIRPSGNTITEKSGNDSARKIKVIYYYSGDIKNGMLMTEKRYNKKGQLILSTDYSGRYDSLPLDYITHQKYEYDKKGRLVKYTLIYDPGTSDPTLYRYNDEENSVCVGSIEKGIYTCYEKYVRNQQGDTILYEGYYMGKINGSTKWEFEYDEKGRKVSEKEFQLNVHWQTWEIRRNRKNYYTGDLLDSIVFDPESPSSYKKESFYDNNKRLVKIIILDSKKIYSCIYYTYDSSNDLTLITDSSYKFPGYLVKYCRTYENHHLIKISRCETKYEWTADSYRYEFY